MSHNQLYVKKKKWHTTNSLKKCHLSQQIMEVRDGLVIYKRKHPATNNGGQTCRDGRGEDTSSHNIDTSSHTLLKHKF